MFIKNNELIRTFIFFNMLSNKMLFLHIMVTLETILNVIYNILNKNISTCIIHLPSKH